MNRKELMELLNVNKEAMKALVGRGTLDKRLGDIGFKLINKEKQGRKSFYNIEMIDESLYELSKIKFESGVSKCRNYENFNIEIDKWNNIGIYYILKDNDIYIGSTIDGYRARFRKHYCDSNEGHMEHTYELLHSGATFNILYDMTGIEDVELIRIVETEYINYFTNYTNFNIINKQETSWSPKKLKYKTIKIQDEKYKKALQLLMDNGFIEC